MFDSLEKVELDTLRRELEAAYHHLKACREIAQVLIKQNWVPKFVKTAQRVIIKRNTGLMEEIDDLMGEM